MRVLVADDMPIVRKLCASILRGAGHFVLEAENGALALEALAAEKIDALMLDLRMPEMDGVAVLKQLATMQTRLFVVIITAGTDAEIREAISLGARTVVLKPFSREHILGSLSRVVSHRHAAEGVQLPVKVYSWAANVDPNLYADAV